MYRKHTHGQFKIYIKKIIYTLQRTNMLIRDNNDTQLTHIRKREETSHTVFKYKNCQVNLLTSLCKKTSPLTFCVMYIVK